MSSPPPTTYARLRHAEDRAVLLFEECVRRGLVIPGKTEGALSDEVCALAREMFGVRRYWHKRIVRAGKNTLLPYAENPPDLAIRDDDLVFFDFGPVFEEWEADIGRSFVVGGDPRKHALAGDVARAWELGAAHYRSTPDLTAAALYHYVCDLALARGWEFGHVHAGHLIGRFPHERAEGDDRVSYVRADNARVLRGASASGEPLHWILEIHFVDRARGFGAFHEGILPA